MTDIKMFKVKAALILPVMDKIADLTTEEDDDVVMLACLGVAAFIQDPDTPTDKLLEIIASTCEYIALQLATVGETVN